MRGMRTFAADSDRMDGQHNLVEPKITVDSSEPPLLYYILRY